MSEQPLRSLLVSLANRLAEEVNDLFASVESLTRTLVDVSDRASEAQRPFDRARLAALRPTILGILDEANPLLGGLGVAVDAEALSDSDHWLEWWHRDRFLRNSFVSHELSPHAIGFYDYTNQEWFRSPIDTGRTMSVGPYYDLGGINEYTVTLAVPVALSTGGQAVVGGDMSLPLLERLMLSELGECKHRVVLVASNSRIICSNTAQHIIGDKLDEDLVADAFFERTIRLTNSRQLGWKLVGITF